MKQRSKRLFSAIVSFVVVLCLSPSAFALTSVTGGYNGISSYSQCTFGDRAGANYVNNFEAELEDLADSDRITYLTLYKNTNDSVTKSAISGASQSTVFVYAGHGLIFDATSNSLHVNKSSTQTVSHSGDEWNTAFNLKTTETTFNQKYVVLYTCNQLTNGGSTTKAENILKMMSGTRLMLGFASSMYLDSREATTFVYRMGWFSNIIDSFNFAANYYQTQMVGDDVIARVVGYTSAANDNLRTYYSYAPRAATNLSSFDVLSSVTIPALGYIQ